MRNRICLFLLIVSFKVFSQTYSGTGGAISDDGLNNDFVINISGLSPAILNSSHGLVNVCININHPYDSDLNIYLIAPDGTEAMLLSGVGGKGKLGRAHGRGALSAGQQPVPPGPVRGRRASRSDGDPCDRQPGALCGRGERRIRRKLAHASSMRGSTRVSPAKKP